ncbi:sensor histidine kinase N-terminal domain-containing protein [Candidatus Sumerlaeota bacterium]|nr:sensor histidine kinase N-terminal domain-containing protein [Candidatus Sumerlaeota bacterium]
MRLSIRLALLVFLVEAIILGFFAIIVYLYCRYAFLENFDFALQANAESLATLVEYDSEDGMELEFADEVMRRFSREKRPDLFAVMLDNGKLLEKSRFLEQLPPFVHDQSNKMYFQDFTNNGHPYRGILLPVSRQVDENPEQKFLIRVLFASSTHQLDENLEGIEIFLAWFFGAGLLLSGLLAGLVSWRGLAPLRRLARETANINEESLSQRLPVDYLPRDLIPVASAVNDLLERLEKAFEREKRFSSDAAHELRTPVTTLKSGIQAALLTSPDREEDRRVLGDLLTDVERLEALCDSLLILSREETVKRESRMILKDWIHEIRNAMQSLQKAAQKNEMRISAHFPENPPENLFIIADTISTRRIAMNLIDNAIRHCPEGSEIRIEIILNESDACLAVKDNGSGVNKEDEPYLFQRFFRADKSRTRATGGFGLGLAISKSLARMHGGDISYQPINPHGSEFKWRCFMEGKHPAVNE